MSIKTLPFALGTIARDYPLLESMIAADESVGSGGGRTTKKSAPPSPGALALVPIAADVAREIHYLAAAVVNGRDDATRAPDSVGMRAEWLQPYAEWLLEVLGEAVLDDTIEAADALARVVTPDGVRRVPIGLCPVVSCAGGALWAQLDSTGKRRMPSVVCDRDSTHRWDEFAYRRLAAMLDGEELPGRMSVPEWLAWAQTRGRPPTLKQVRMWTWHRPITVGWSAESKTLDAVRTMDYWLDLRARRAG